MRCVLTPRERDILLAGGLLALTGAGGPREIGPRLAARRARARSQRPMCNGPSAALAPRSPQQERDRERHGSAADTGGVHARRDEPMPRLPRDGPASGRGGARPGAARRPREPRSLWPQLDGLGGGISSLSKACIVGPSTHPEADVDYTFAQVHVTRAEVDYAGNCGNCSSAVGPFAIDEGLVPAVEGETLVRVHNTNTKKLIVERVPVRGGEAEVGGDFELPGVAGRGARIALDFLDPGGAGTGRLLPTGRARDVIQGLEASCVDATNPLVFVRARDLGLAGTERPEAVDADRALVARLDAIRVAAAQRMGIPGSASVPKVAVVAPPAAFAALDGSNHDAAEVDVVARVISMGNCHRAFALTAAMCLAVAAKIDGSVVAECARPAARAGDADVRLGHPSGVLPIAARVVIAARRASRRARHHLSHGAPAHGGFGPDPLSPTGEPMTSPRLSPFTAEHELLRRTVRGFVEKEVVAARGGLGRGRPDPARRSGAASASWASSGSRFPAEYGGAGGDFLSNVVLGEEMARCRSGGVAFSVLVHTDMSSPWLTRFGTDEQKQKYLPGIVARRYRVRARHHRARSRLRHGGPGHPGRTPRRSVRAPRQQDLHHQRRPRRPLLRGRAHRTRRPPAGATRASRCSWSSRTGRASG